MAAFVHDDARTLSEQFFELILADPDFFEDAFAAVEASWSGRPPGAQTSTWTPYSKPNRSTRRQQRGSLMTARPFAAPTFWQRQKARSPPTFAV